MRLGDFEIDIVSDGTFALDGGSLFSVVPRVVWERYFEPDEQNRIRIGLNALLVRTGRENVLVDTGIGYKWDARSLDRYSIRHETNVIAELGRLGLEPEDIDIVINTHLHFDHAGGDKTKEGLAFPRAQYVVQKGELNFAQHTNERTAGSYLAHNFADVPFRLIEGETEILPGIRGVPTPGHVPYHQSILIRSGGETACFVADLVPTAAHLPLPWIMGYDLEPLVTLDTRKRIYQRAEAEGWLMVFEHDPGIIAGRLGRDGKGVALVEPMALH